MKCSRLTAKVWPVSTDQPRVYLGANWPHHTSYTQKPCGLALLPSGHADHRRSIFEEREEREKRRGVGGGMVGGGGGETVK